MGANQWRVDHEVEIGQVGQQIRGLGLLQGESNPVGLNAEAGAPDLHAVWSRTSSDGVTIESRGISRHG